MLPRRNSWPVHVFAVLTTALLGVGWWALSGGAAFAPEVRPAEIALAPDLSPAVAPVEDPQVAATAEPVAPETEAAPVINLAEGTVTEPATGEAPVLATRSAAANEAFAAEVAAQPVPEASPDVAASGLEAVLVVGDFVNLRDGPGTEFGVVTQLAGGARAEVLGREGDWVYLRGPAGDIGWMADRFVTPADG